MSMTSITSTTVISSSSAAFTLLLSVAWLRERLTALKLLGVALCTLGNGLTAAVDVDMSNATASGTNATDAGGGPPASFRGDTICLLSAVLYACYTVLIRRLAPTDLSLFFGFLGLSTFLLFGPVVLVLHLTGVEDLHALTPAVAGLLVLKGLFDNVLSDYLWAAAVLLTSPSVATIGMSLTVPLAIVSDVALPPEWLVDAVAPTPLSLLAAVAVVGGFVAITAAGRAEAEGADAHGGCDVAMSVPLLSRSHDAGRGAPDEPSEPAPPEEEERRRGAGAADAT